MDTKRGRDVLLSDVQASSLNILSAVRKTRSRSLTKKKQRPSVQPCVIPTQLNRSLHSSRSGLRRTPDVMTNHTLKPSLMHTPLFIKMNCLFTSRS